MDTCQRTTGLPGFNPDTYRGVPVLVLGGSGFIGAWMARALAARGAEVSVAARDAARAVAALGPVARRVRVLVADLCDAAALDPLLGTAQPAVVFNLAGYGVDPSERDPALMATLNTRMVEALCARLAESPDRGWPGAKLVQTGSALEYGAVRGTLGEETPPNPTTEYGRTKLLATRAIVASCAASGLRAVVARLFTVYGMGEHSHRLLPALVRTARTGDRLALTSGRQPRDFTYVEDVVEGLLRLGASHLAGDPVINLATGRLATVREFAETAAAVIGFDRSLLDFGALPERQEEMWHGEVDVRRLRAETAWSPQTSVADGIGRTWELHHAA